MQPYHTFIRNYSYFLVIGLLLLNACNTETSLSLPYNQVIDETGLIFDINVTGKLLKKIRLEIENETAYANLSLKQGERVLVDNLDIPDTGRVVFNLLVNFKKPGHQKISLSKKGTGHLILRQISLKDCANIAFPNFEDISQKAGLITEETWKYGGPSIADVDGNGLYDLILNNHDKVPTQLFLQIEKGKLKQVNLFPWRADFHGTTAGDFDRDGDLDLVNAVGGGNGTSPQPALFLRNDLDSFAIIGKEIGIKQGARGRSVRFLDMDLDGDLDLLAVNAAGINSSDSVQHIFYNNLGDGNFEIIRSKDIENANAERVLVTDLNQDQIDDLVLYSPLSIWIGKGDFTFENITKKILPVDLWEIDLITGITDIDIDNDGDLDLYLSRGKTYYQMANKSLDFHPELGRIDLRDEGNKAVTTLTFTAPDSILLSGLFLWYRLYDGGFPLHLGAEKELFKFEEGDSLWIAPEMAQGWPTERAENGWYLGYLGDQTWKLEWVRKEAIYWGIRLSIHGVEDVSSEWKPQNRNVQDLLLENRNTTFRNVSKAWNIPLGGNHQGVTVGDFNNDSFNDLYVYRFGFLKSRVKDWLLLNNTKGAFEISTNHNAYDPNDRGHGDMGQAFDFDLDGRLDLLNGSDDPGKWNLFKNQTESQNKGIIIKVGYSPKENVDPYAAVVNLQTSKFSLTKRVGSAGEIHAQSLLNMVHFGLGEKAKPVKVSVRWRNGEEQVLPKSAFKDAKLLYELGISPQEL